MTLTWTRWRTAGLSRSLPEAIAPRSAGLQACPARGREGPHYTETKSCTLRSSVRRFRPIGERVDAPYRRRIDSGGADLREAAGEGALVDPGRRGVGRYAGALQLARLLQRVAQVALERLDMRL